MTVVSKIHAAATRLQQQEQQQQRLAVPVVDIVIYVAHLPPSRVVSLSTVGQCVWRLQLYAIA